MSRRCDILKLTALILVLVLAVSVLPAQVFAEDTVAESYSEAGRMLREGMKARQETITVRVRTAETEPTAVARSVWAEATAHTGVPTEGDYLLKQLGGYDMRIGWKELEEGRQYALTYTIDFYTTAAQEEELKGAVEELLYETLEIRPEMEDYEKVKRVWDYMAAHISYDRDHLEDENYKRKYTAYAALMDRTAVCQGYANLMYRLMLELGLDCRLINGVTDDGNGHAWNIVKLGDVYYNLDPGWGTLESSQDYLYFLRCDENYPDHNRSAAFASEAFYREYPMSERDFLPPRSGSCGDDLTWHLDENNVLHISGTGTMNRYGNGFTLWGDAVKAVVLEEGITTLSDYAFHGLKGVTEVSLPDSLEEIGDRAFSKCRALKRVTIPEGVARMGSDVFSGCIRLSRVEFLGNAPRMLPDTFGSGSLSCRYPAGAEGWTAELREGCGGTIGWVPVYEIAGGAEITVNPDLGDALTIRADAGNAKVKTLRIDGKALDQDDYTVSGSAVTIDPGYLETLPEGSCSVELGFSPGIATAELTIRRRNISGDTDNDGDVDVDDAIYLLYHVLFGDGYPISQDCDFDGSGDADVDDAIYLLYHVLFGEGYPLN